MMSCLELRVDPTRTVSADAYQVHQHLGPVLGEGNRARLVAIMKVHRYLLDLEVVRSGDEQTFQVEAKATECLTREDRLRGVCGEAFESRLGVENPWKQHQLRELVEQAAHEVTRVEIVEKSRTHHVP